MVAIFMTAVPVASIGQSTGSVLPVPGIGRPTTRAETMQNAITIHDEVARRVCGPTAEATSLNREQACPEWVYGQNPLMHLYWTWLIRILFCVGTILVACLAFTSYRAAKGFLPLAVVVAVLALLDTANLVLGGWIDARLSKERLERAEWQWRLDLAKASYLPGDEGGTSALEAARRYAVAVSPR